MKTNAARQEARSKNHDPRRRENGRGEAGNSNDNYDYFGNGNGSRRNGESEERESGQSFGAYRDRYFRDLDDQEYASPDSRFINDEPEDASYNGNGNRRFSNDDYDDVQDGNSGYENNRFGQGVYTRYNDRGSGNNDYRRNDRSYNSRQESAYADRGTDRTFGRSTGGYEDFRQDNEARRHEKSNDGRGFASMDRDQVRRIAASGGRNAHGGSVHNDWRNEDQPLANDHRSTREEGQYDRKNGRTRQQGEPQPQHFSQPRDAQGHFSGGQHRRANDGYDIPSHHPARNGHVSRSGRSGYGGRSQRTQDGSGTGQRHHRKA